MPSALEKEVRERVADFFLAEEQTQSTIKKVEMAELEGGEAFVVTLCNFLFAVVLFPCYILGTINILGQR